MNNTTTEVPFQNNNIKWNLKKLIAYFHPLVVKKELMNTVLYINKAEHAVQSYAAGVWGLGAWGYGLYLQYADHMVELHGPYWSKRREEQNQWKTILR